MYFLQALSYKVRSHETFFPGGQRNKAVQILLKMKRISPNRITIAHMYCLLRYYKAFLKSVLSTMLWDRYSYYPIS